MIVITRNLSKQDRYDKITNNGRIACENSPAEGTRADHRMTHADSAGSSSVRSLNIGSHSSGHRSCCHRVRHSFAPSLQRASSAHHNNVSSEGQRKAREQTEKGERTNEGNESEMSAKPTRKHGGNGERQVRLTSISFVTNSSCPKRRAKMSENARKTHGKRTGKREENARGNGRNGAPARVAVAPPAAGSTARGQTRTPAGRCRCSARIGLADAAADRANQRRLGSRHIDRLGFSRRHTLWRCGSPHRPGCGRRRVSCRPGITSKQSQTRECDRRLFWIACEVTPPHSQASGSAAPQPP